MSDEAIRYDDEDETGTDVEVADEQPTPDGIEISANRKIFQIKISGEDEPVTLVLPLKWKRLGFTRAMSKGDIWGAFESIWPQVPLVDEETGKPELDIDGEPRLTDSAELEQLANLDIDEDEFKMILERLGETLMKRKRPTRGTFKG